MSWENACTGAPGGGWDYAPCVGPPSPKDSDSEPGPSARYAASLTFGSHQGAAVVVGARVDLELEPELELLAGAGAGFGLGSGWVCGWW